MKSIRKFSLFIFSLLIPIIIIYVSMDVYITQAITTLIERLQDTLHNKVDGVESTIQWKAITGRLIVGIIIYKYLVKRYIDAYKERLSAKEKRQSIILLVIQVLKTFTIWTSLYVCSNLLGINDESYFNSVNLILYSVAAGEGFRIYEVYYEKVSKYK